MSNFIAGGSSESVYDPMRSVLASLRSEGMLREPLTPDARERVIATLRGRFSTWRASDPWWHEAADAAIAAMQPLVLVEWYDRVRELAAWLQLPSDYTEASSIWTERYDRGLSPEQAVGEARAERDRVREFPR